MIVEEPNEINISVPAFDVDSILHPQIPTPLPNSSFSMAIIAPPGSGKTSLLTSFICQTDPPLYKGVFDKVYLFQPLTSFNSMKDNPFKGHPRVYHELDEQALFAVQTEIEKSAKSKQNSLVIIDDYMAELKNKEIQKIFVRFVANRRHLRMSVIFLTQTFRSIPLSLRKNIGNWILFKASSKREIESIGDEIGMSKQDFDKLYNYIFAAGSERHQFMYIDSSTNVYKKFSKLTIK